MNKRNKVFAGLFWSFAERISAQLVTLIVTIILARILAPSDYGIISIVMVLITLCNIFVSTGFVSALIQKKEASEVDYNTAFMLSISFAFVVYILLFFASPYIARFYGNDILCPVFRVMGLRLILAAVNSIQQAYIRREMQFKRFFIATLIGTLVSGCAGIALAYSGAGVWALVTQYLTNTTVDTIVLLVVGGWRPKIQFSKSSAQSTWTFGWKVLVTQLICGLKDNIRSLIIGKVFGTSDLAYYDQGKRYPSILVTNIDSAVEKVMLPVYSREQDNLLGLKSMLRRTIKVGVFVLAPMLIGFAVVSEQFVIIVLTEKWLPAVPFIQVFCFSYLTRPLEVACRQALLAIGKSKEVLYCNIAIAGTDLCLVFVSVFVLKSVMAIALFSLLTTLISITVFLRFTNKFLRYSLKEQIADFLPSLGLALCMGICVSIIGIIKMNTFALTTIQILFGAGIYIIGSKKMKLEPYIFLVSFIKRKKN